MKIFSTEHTFKYYLLSSTVFIDYCTFCRHPWDRVSIANWIKYPNDLTPHVLHVDYLSRQVDDNTGILHTERLLTCRQNAPAFISRLFGGENSSLFYEKSEVDREGRTLTLRSRNLTFCNLLMVEEVCRYVQTAEGNTLLRQEASIKSFTSWSHIANAMEEFIVTRFQANAQRGRQALEHAIERIYRETKEQVLDAIYFFDPSKTETVNVIDDKASTTFAVDNV